MRARVAQTIVDALSALDLAYPNPSEKEQAGFEAARYELSGADGK
jgi:hypothetical protein